MYSYIHLTVGWLDFLTIICTRDIEERRRKNSKEICEKDESETQSKKNERFGRRAQHGFELEPCIGPGNTILPKTGLDPLLGVGLGLLDANLFRCGSSCFLIFPLRNVLRLGFLIFLFK